MALNGWLSPDGELDRCGSRDHVNAAIKIADKLGYTNEGSYTQPDDVLHSRGWVRIQRGYMIPGNNQRATEAQLHWLWNNFDFLDDDMKKLLMMDDCLL